MTRFLPVLLLGAIGCASAPSTSRAPSPPSTPPATPAGVAYIELTIPTYEDRYGGRSVSLEATRDGESWSWRAVFRRSQYGDDHRASSSSTQCTARELTTSLAPIATTLEKTPIDDHHRRGGSGPVTIRFRTGDSSVRTQVQCDPLQTDGAGLCATAQALVAAYLDGVEVKPARADTGALAMPLAQIEQAFAARSSTLDSSLCERWR